MFCTYRTSRHTRRTGTQDAPPNLEGNISEEKKVLMSRPSVFVYTRDS